VAENVVVFISHSSADDDLARALAELIRIAFRMKTAQIRCTTVDGYRLPAGADTDQQLRQEIADARVFIGVFTPNSARSDYVLFELGARWGVDKHLVPVFGCGYRPSALPGPIRNRHALDISRRPQVLDLLHAIERLLRRPQEQRSATESGVDAVVRAASRSSAAVSSDRSALVETARIRMVLRDVAALSRSRRKRK
jgi:hypothetical protein